MAEDGLTETYRGDVEAWECDSFGHMNIAFYGERFGDAAASLLFRHAPARSWRTTSLFVRYLKELREGESVVIGSAVIGTAEVNKGERIARIGHEMRQSDGQIATVAEHALAPFDAKMRGTLKGIFDGAAAAWKAAGFAAIALPAKHGPYPTIRDRVKSWELDERGRLSLFGHVRRFSTASGHLMNRVGLTADYIHKARRGFATFETRLALAPFQPGAGAEVAGTSGLMKVGNSSVVMIHDLVETRNGERIARFYQAGVHFDLDKRKSAALPDDLRAKAMTMLIAD